MKKFTLWLFALLSCWQISAQVGIIENFDSGTATPAGWTNTNFNNISAAESCSGNSNRSNLYSFSTTSNLVTPNQVAASNGTDLTVSFDYKIENWNTTNATPAGWGNFQVQYSTNNGGLWTTFFTVNDVNHVVANTCANFSNVIPAASLPNGSDVKIRFLCTWVSGDFDIYIDNFSATQTTALPPACSLLTTPANGALNISNSNIIWAPANGIPTGYKLTVGTTPGGTNVLNLFDVGNVTTYNLGALLAGTTYYVKVTPYNANGDATGCTESSFTTCGAISVFPHLEPFTTFLPNPCWVNGVNGDLTTGPAAFTGSGWGADGLGNVGTTGAIRNNIFTTGANDWVISPEFTIPAVGYELKLDAAAVQYNNTTIPTTPWESDDFIEILVSSTGTTNWTVLHVYNDTNQPSNVATPLSLDLSAYATQTVRFAFRAVEGSTVSGADIDFSIDNFQVRLIPTCPDQTALYVGNITATTADFSWEAVTGNVGYEYAVTTSATPPASGTATIATIYSAASLAPQTVYYLHVRSECAGSTYGNWSTLSFITNCASVTSFVQNFDTVTAPAFPTCWEKVGTGGLANTQTASPNSAPNTLYIYGTSVTDRAVVKMQPISNLGAGTHRLNFDMRGNFSAGDAVEVGYLTDPADNATFVTFDTFTASSLTYANFTYAPPAGVYSDYIAFRHAGNLGLSVLIDNVKWELLPSCPDQSNLTVGTITSTTADFSWDALTGIVGYEYAITTSATPPASGTATVATIYSASSLAPQTVYYLHVRSECVGSTYGTWATISFTTACAPISTLPWNEGFEGLTVVGPTEFPSCWSKENGDWTSDNFNGTYSTANTGTNYIKNSWSATNEFIWTPGFDLVAGTSYDFSSFVQGDNGTGWVVDYFVNSAQNSTGANQLGASYNVPGTGIPYAFQPYAQVTRSFVPTSTGTYYFAVRVNQPSGGPWYVSFDDFRLIVSPSTPPACTTNLVATPNACGNFANNLTWDAEPLANGYYITIGTTSGGTDIANAVNVGTNSYSFTGSISTTYFWSVVPYNAAGSATGCVEQSFTAAAIGCYCTSVPSSNDGLGITNAVVGGGSNAIADVTYVDLTAATVVTTPGLNTDVQLTFSTGFTYDINIWIDFNNDYDFDDAGELVKTGIACTDVEPNTVDASFIMPLTAPTGIHRMRIGTADFGQVPPDPCYNGDYGVVLDFNVDTTLSSNSFDKSNFVAYPNPVKDILNLSYNTAISNVKVVNLLGQEVLNSKTNTNDVKVDMSSLTSGAYIVSITVDATIHTIKVIKQ